MADIVFDPNKKVDFDDNSFTPATENTTASLMVESMDQTIRTHRANQKLAAEVAYLQAGVRDTNPIEEYQASMAHLEAGGDLNAMYDELKLEYMAQEEQKMLEAVDEHIQAAAKAGVPLTNLPDYSTIQQGVQDSLSLYMDNDGIERMRADLYATESVEDMEIRQEMMRQYANRRVTEDMGERSTLDTTTDVFDSVIPLGFLKDVGDVTGSYFKGIPEFVEAAYKYQRLDPEEQQLVYDEVWHPRIMEASNDNKFVAEALVEALHNPEVLAEMYITGAIDLTFAYEAAQLARWGYKASKAVSERRSIAKQYNELGNDEASGTTVGISSKVNDSAPTGMSKADAAQSASPNASPDITPGAMDQVSDVVQNARKTAEQRLKDELALDITEGFTRTERKNITKSIRRLQKKLLAAQTTAASLTKPVARNAAARSAVAEAKRATAERITALEQQIAIREQKLALVPKETTQIDLLNLQQGHIPARLQQRFEQIVNERIQKELAAKSGKHDASVQAARANAKEQSGGSQLIEETIVNEGARGSKLLNNPELYGVSEEYAEVMRATIADPMRKLSKELSEDAPEVLTGDQKAKIQIRVMEELQQAANSSGKEISFATPVPSKSGFTVKYSQDGIDEEFTYKWTVNDIGLFEAIDSTPNVASSVIRRSLGSARAMLEKFSATIVNDIKYGQDQAARSVNQLTKQFQDIEKGLSKDQLKELDTLLLMGDEAGEVYKFNDLIDGVIEIKGVGKHKVDRAVVDAYYAKRVFFDELHSLRDYYMRRQLAFEGFKDVSYVSKVGGRASHLMARTVDADTVARSRETLVYDLTGEVNKRAKYINKDTASAFVENKGYKYVELAEPRTIRGKRVKYAILDETDQLAKPQISELPPKVLNYSKGYIPRIYQKGYYFVKSDIDGSTAFAAETRELAMKWARQATEESQDGARFSVKFDGEMDGSESMVENAKSFGGLYTGTRSKKPLEVKKEGGEFEKARRADNNDATESYIQSISNVMPLNEYRSMLVTRWENTVRQLLEAEGKVDAAKRLSFRNKKERIGLSNSVMEAEMEDMRSYISHMAGVSTNEEIKTANFMANLADHMYGKPIVGGKVRDWVLNHLDDDPIVALKGLTFNLHLGWFNVRQLFVQAQNASIAMSISPQHAPGAIKDAMALRAVIFSENPDVWRKMGEMAPGVDADDFVKNVEQFKRSGLLDGIVRQGDWNNHATGVAHQSFKTFRTVAKAGQLFFKEGELAARMMAWGIARRRLPKDATIQQISDETTRLTMDLSTANSAKWQQNILGVPTQFLQVQAKFLENVLPTALGGSTRWSPAEKWSAFGGQVALYGTIGIPVAQDAASYAAELMGITPQEYAEKYPEVVEGIEEGVVGILTSALGIENNLSTSGSLVQGLFSNNSVTKMVRAWNEMLIDGDTTVAIDDIIGPAASSIKRAASPMVTLWDNARILWTTPSAENAAFALREFGDDILSMTSTWSNAKKALHLHSLGLQSRKGSTMIAPDKFEELSDVSLVMRGMGFPFDIEQAYYEQKSRVLDKKKQLRSSRQDLQHAWNRYLVHGNLDRLKTEELVILAPYTEPERRQLKHATLKAAFNPKDDLDKQSQSFIKMWFMGGGTDVYPTTQVELEGTD